MKYKASSLIRSNEEIRQKGFHNLRLSDSLESIYNEIYMADNRMVLVEKDFTADRVHSSRG